MGLCFAEDDFILEKLRWFVSLSNGQTVYQDDNRPGEDPPQAWLRLAEYCLKNNLHIINFYIQFCSHIEEAAPANALAYYYIQGVEAFASVKRTFRYYVVGAILLDNPNILRCNRWLVPEILPLEYEERPVPEGDQCLIWRKNEAKNVVMNQDSVAVG